MGVLVVVNSRRSRWSARVDRRGRLRREWSTMPFYISSLVLSPSVDGPLFFFYRELSSQHNTHTYTTLSCETPGRQPTDESNAYANERQLLTHYYYDGVSFSPPLLFLCCSRYHSPFLFFPFSIFHFTIDSVLFTLFHECFSFYHASCCFVRARIFMRGLFVPLLSIIQLHVSLSFTCPCPCHCLSVIHIGHYYALILA
jgi:hypothetical protein